MDLGYLFFLVGKFESKSGASKIEWHFVKMSLTFPRYDVILGVYLRKADFLQ